MTIVNHNDGKSTLANYAKLTRATAKKFGGVSSQKKSPRVKTQDTDLFSVTRPAREKGPRVRLNIAGKIFETYERTLLSREDSIFRLDGISQMFDTKRNEYYFERDGKSFEAILTYMQCGICEKPEKVPYKIFIEELQYFGFHDLAERLYKENCSPIVRIERDIKKVKGMRNYIWHVMEYPRICELSKYFTLVQSLVIILSTLLIAVSSIPALHEHKVYSSVYHKIEFTCLAWYTIETFVRFYTCADKMKFFRRPLNITDILSFLLVYILYFTTNTKHIFLPSLLRLLRVTRLIPAFGSKTFVRIFDTTMLTLVSSVKEFTTFSSLLVFLLMLFACLLYQVENGESYYNEDFSSVPRTIWFCVVTITSVGYGDIVPTSSGGRLVTISMFGATILILSLPVPIIINNFMRTNELLKKDSTVCEYIFNPLKSNEVVQTLAVMTQSQKTTGMKKNRRRDEGGRVRRAGVGEQTIVEEDDDDIDGKRDKIEIEENHKATDEEDTYPETDSENEEKKNFLKLVSNENEKENAKTRREKNLAKSSIAVYDSDLKEIEMDMNKENNNESSVKYMAKNQKKREIENEEQGNESTGSSFESISMEESDKHSLIMNGYETDNDDIEEEEKFYYEKENEDLDNGMEKESLLLHNLKKTKRKYNSNERFSIVRNEIEDLNENESLIYQHIKLKKTTSV